MRTPLTDLGRVSAPLLGTAAALAAAISFGVSAPLAKSLLPEAQPLMLGAVLYLGAGLGLSIVRYARRTQSREAQLRRSDVPLLCGVTIAGGVLAPVLLLAGLQRVSAVTGSLVLNLEGPLTVVVAVLFFGEHLGVSGAAGALLVMLGAAVLSLVPGAALHGDILGVLAIAGACLAWALDNNLTQRLSLRDPLAIVQAKGLLGGGSALALAVAVGNAVPPARTVAWGLLLGFLSYGLSVVLAVYAMRLIGVVREAAFFATAPFIGVLVSVAILGEHFGRRELAAMLLMLAGLGLLLRERHSHVHAHEAMQHDHRHVHDAHHRHAHVSDDPAGEPHTHEHEHPALEHDHPHMPDVHHRHH
jgi:drug/metabolite transporter (DMT)-like permease